jgi:SPP1 family predicted phage head-tail adaptor
MIIGKLRHRLTLQSPTETRGATGEVLVAYSTDSTVWGSLRPLTGREVSASNQTVEEINYRAEIRYHSTIKSEWRVVNDSNTYEVVTVLNYDELNEYMILELKRIA